MIKFLVLLLGLCIIPLSFGDVWVEGYTRKNGTRVDGYYRTEPDGYINNNWSTQGNVNPHTGKRGTVSRNPNEGDVYYSAPSTPQPSTPVVKPSFDKITPEERAAIKREAEKRGKVVKDIIFTGSKGTVLVSQSNKEELTIDGRSYKLLYTLKAGHNLVYGVAEGKQVMGFYDNLYNLSHVWVEEETYYK